MKGKISLKFIQKTLIKNPEFYNKFHLDKANNKKGSFIYFLNFQFLNNVG
jgi:hypothetical protein